ncbi:hypothetical protein TRV_05753 [Trichophyton verrucosum HKI 0517]|uniref:Uncharacterized protein n=1 Tax=Trichophyton verrucosum (strain HKI 0517) TaxID=663202 RepID=D4DF12_TRIVH|nr:uncharacterized protein TRV_05753 [Trichophyton verrucosum HKI 0517]EFE39560.1 hypothetical protein TRV_05753 [Trichophyton verrucosum HKI 0517]
MQKKRREEKRRAISRKDEWNDYGKAERTKNEDTSRQAIRITRQTDKAKHADFIFLVSYLLLVGSFAAKEKEGKGTKEREKLGVWKRESDNGKNERKYEYMGIVS